MQFVEAAERRVEEPAIFLEDREQARTAQDPVEAGGAFERRDLSHDRLGVLRRRNTVRDQPFAGLREVAHLDRRAKRTDEQREHHGCEAEHQQSAQGAWAERRGTNGLPGIHTHIVTCPAGIFLRCLLKRHAPRLIHIPR